MEDLKSNPNVEEKLEGEADLTLEYFFSFSDLNELPKLFYSRLTEFCDRTLADLEEVKKILPEENKEDPYLPDALLACRRAKIHSRLSTGSLYNQQGEELPRIPLFENYSSIVVDDFIFI